MRSDALSPLVGTGVRCMAQPAIRKTKPASLDGQSFRNRTKISRGREALRSSHLFSFPLA